MGTSVSKPRYFSVLELILNKEVNISYRTRMLGKEHWGSKKQSHNENKIYNGC